MEKSKIALTFGAKTFILKPQWNHRCGNIILSCGKNETSAKGWEYDTLHRARGRAAWKRDTMDDYQYVRCLFCKTGKEEMVVRAVEEKNWGHALFPKRAKRVRVNGQWQQVLTPLLPGYVFVYFSADSVLYEAFSDLQYVIRVLRYDADEEADVLLGRDREFADWIWRQNGEIGIMKAVQVGDKVEIIDTAFQKLRGTITKMDKRRKTVRVELNTEGAIKGIWLAYDIVSRV